MRNIVICIVVGICMLLLNSYVWADERIWTDEQIVNAIFQAEGGYKAQYLFGIRSVKYNSFKEAERICYNTVRNNRKRYKEYGYEKYNSYLEFLASRYAPLNVNNDPNNLNRYWLKNVLFFLKNK